MARSVELLIVGGGAAGLSAGLYAARARLDALLLERMGAGGQLSTVARVENFPGFPAGISGPDLAALLANQAMDAGLQMTYGEATALRPGLPGEPHRIDTDGEAIDARAVILACGSSPAWLGAAGEEEFVGRGVSSCATCDGEFCRGQPVVVVGGGDSAVDEALYLAKIASSVTVVHRRQALRAERIGQERLLAAANCRMLWNTRLLEIRGDEVVRGALVQTDGEPSSHEIAAAGVFVYAGLTPNTAWLASAVEIDAAGHVAVDARLQTSRPGVFAAGDLRQHSARQLAASAGDGVSAAIWAERFLRGANSR